MNSAYHPIRRNGMPRWSWLSPLDWFELGFSFHFVASVLSFSLLLGTYATLVALLATNALNSQVFDIGRIDAVTQLVVGISQASIVILTAVLCFTMEALAADTVLRRRQSVAALQDNLAAWRGLGTSFMSLWRGRKLGVVVWFRITVVLVFFLAISALQIVTPTVITVDTTNATNTRFLNAKRMALDDAIAPALFNFTGETSIGRAISALSSLPYVWGQRNTSVAGAPPGFNGTLFFSPLEKTVSEDFVYTDPYAREARTFCASIPPSSTDYFDFTFQAEPIASSGSYGIFNVRMDVGTVIPNSGPVRFGNDFNAVPGSFGGEKATNSSPPTYFFPDALLRLPQLNSSSTPLGNIYAWAFITNRSDALAPDTDRGVLPPSTFTMQTTVQSWVHNDSLTPQEEQALAFSEPLNVTFHVWPIACSFNLENATAFVRGTNALISYTTSNQESSSQSPFDSPHGLSDPLVNYWGRFIDVIENLELGGRTDVIFQLNFLEDQLRPLLNETSVPTLTDLPLNTSASRFTAFADNLNRLSGNAYSLLLNAMQTTSALDANHAVWTPPQVTVQAQQTVLVGRLRVNVLQLVLGSISVLCVGACMVVVLWERRVDVDVSSGGTSFMSGGILELVHLMHLSALPRLIAGDSNEARYRDARRSRAENVVVEYTGVKLDTVGREGDAGDALPLVPYSESFPDLPDYLDLTTKALLRADTHSGTSTNAKRHPCISALTPYTFAAQVSLGLLTAFHVALLIFWARGTFDHRLFSLKKIGFITQFIAITTQVFSVLTLALLCFVVQAIASDRIVRRKQTLAELHDGLGAWSGLGASVMALLRQARPPAQISIHVVLVALLYAAVATLHITVPSVLSIGTVSTVGDLASIAASRMPGNVTIIGYDRTGEATSAELQSVITSIPYLWERRNSTRLPPGWNGTTFFSTLDKTLPSAIILEDPHAVDLNIKCGVVPRSNSRNESITSAFDPAQSPASFNNFTIKLENTFDFYLPDGAYSISLAFAVIKSGGDSIQLGGGKASMNSPPVIRFDDYLVYAALGYGMNAYDYGSTYMGYWSMRNDSLNLPSDIDYAPPIAQSFNATVWSWIIQPNLTQEEQQARAFRENATVNLYYYPIACSLFLDNVTATTTGGGSLLNVTPQETDLHHTPYPFLRTLPSNGLERTFWDLIDSSSIIAGDWIQSQLLTAIVNGTGLSSMEKEFSAIAAMHYALLVQDWKTRLQQGDTTVKALWTPESVTLGGTQPLVFARLRINVPQLLSGAISTMLLTLVALATIWGHDIHDSVVRDGGVIDMISLLDGSLLPAIVASSAESELGDGRRARRQLAERTYVAYSDALLDIPERVQLKFGQSRMASTSNLPAFPQHEEDYINPAV